MSTTLTIEDVERIARLANLELTRDENSSSRNSSPTSSPTPSRCRASTRRESKRRRTSSPRRRAPDEPTPSLEVSDAVANAPDAAPEAGPLPRAAGHRMTRSRQLGIREAIVSGKASAVEICACGAARSIEDNPTLNAFNHVVAERAIARATLIDQQRAAGATLGPLAGVPVALKDNLCVKGVRTTASSKILDTFHPPYSATVVDKLEAAGAVIVGKTNCDEFAMGSSNENSARTVRNPWDRSHAGGSSGGSAAAVAARSASAGARIGYRRIDPAAGVVLRRRRAQTNLRDASPAMADGSHHP